MYINDLYMSALKMAKKFRSEKECLEFLEVKRWGKEIKCPYCQSFNVSTHNEIGRTSRHQCSTCKKSFSVLVGTIFESSKLSLIKWFTAIAIIIEAKKGISALQLSRHLDVNYKTAWAISHKIRSAMASKKLEMFGGVVQMDETYVYTDNDDNDRSGHGRKANTSPVVAIASEGNIKAFQVNDIKAETLFDIAKKHIVKGSTLHTDANQSYKRFNGIFNHKAVKHLAEFVSKAGVHTNMVEGFWGLLKRGIEGQFHHISQKYLQSYINEFEFRFNRRKIKSETIFEELLLRGLGL